MNDKPHQVPESPSQSGTCTLWCLAALAMFTLASGANDLTLGPLVQISDPNPLAGCDDGLRPPGRNSIDAQAEPYLAVNPANPKNIVAVWISGFAQGIIAGVTFDGGRRWQQVPIPALTVCSGGPFLGAADPWVSFAPNGDVYVVCLAFGPFGAIPVAKSTDGGLHWAAPVVLAAYPDKHDQPDKPSITADWTDARFVYAVWDRNNNGNRGEALFSRTTDGGQTWEPARVIYDAGAADHQAFGNQILVLPNGALVDFFTEEKFVFDGSTSNDKLALLSLILSLDKGQTWSAPIRIAVAPLFIVTDPETGNPVQNAGRFALFDVGVDPQTGNLYAIWEDTRFGNGQYGSIAFAMSADGGSTWSTPIRVNQTPTNIAAGNRQAFLPAIAVASDGTIAVSYYDFRFNDPNAGLPTDYWLVHCHPTPLTPATDPRSWTSEVRLTDASFDLERSLIFVDSYFLGDYMGLAAAGSDFVTVFTQTQGTDPDSIFFRRVGQ
jgi:hypothetical protein